MFYLQCVTRYSKNEFGSMIRRLKQELPKAFTLREIQQLAADSKYHQRADAKINGYTFLQLVLFHSPSLMNDSLEDLSQHLEIEHSVDISKQALQERFNTYAVEFLKVVFKELLNKKIPKEPIITQNLHTIQYLQLSRGLGCWLRDFKSRKDFSLSFCQLHQILITRFHCNAF